MKERIYHSVTLFKNKIPKSTFFIVKDKKSGKSFGKQMLQLAIEYAKNKLGAKKITLGVFNENISALKCYKSVGFQIVGEDSYVIDGEEWKGVEMEVKGENWCELNAIKHCLNC